MNIHNLDHWETISQAPRVVGGLSLFSFYSLEEEFLKEKSLEEKLLSLEERYPEYTVYSTSARWDAYGEGEAGSLTVAGYSQKEDATFAYASTRVTSSSSGL